MEGGCSGAVGGGGAVSSRKHVRVRPERASLRGPLNVRSDGQWPMELVIAMALPHRSKGRLIRFVCSRAIRVVYCMDKRGMISGAN